MLFRSETIDGLKRYKISGKVSDWGYILHGSPVINANFHIANYNLTLKDFPQQDYIAEYLILLQTSIKALEELQHLNNEFRIKNKALEESQVELLKTSLFPQENPNPVLRLSLNFELLYANPSAAEFMIDFDFNQNKLIDADLIASLTYVEERKIESYSTYFKRNQNTYLLNIRKNLDNDFYNVYAANITHFVDQVAQKENELTEMNIKLEKQQEFYEYILNNIPADIAVFDELHRYLFVNPLAIKNEEVRKFIIGKDDYDYCAFKNIPTTGADQRRKTFLTVLNENKELEWEDELITPEGKRNVILRRMRPIYNPITEKTNVVGYGIDITQRKLAEEEVKQYASALFESNQTIQTINEELKKVVQAEKTVNLLADSFLTGTDYEEICWDIVENIISQLDFEDSVIYKLEGKELVQIAAMGNKTQTRRALKNAMRIPLGEGIVGSVAKTGKPLLIEDTSKDLRYIVDDESRMSEVAVPIKVGKKVWGVIDSENINKGFFTELHLRVLLTISNLLAQKIAALEEQKQKENLQNEILEINADLEQRVLEATNQNLELSKSIKDQEKLVTIGEIASGIAHDLNTPLGAIKIGAESIRFTIDNLFTNVVAKCTESQINFAINRSIENQGDLFVGGLQQRKEMKELDDYLIDSFPNIDALHRSKLVTMMVKSRILPNQSELITQVIESENALDFLELIYSLQITRNFIETILTSSERATNVVQDLRSFIKDQRNNEKGPIHIFDNINTVLNIFNYDIKRSVELILDIEKELYIDGFDIKLFQLWSNIIKNAIESLDQYRDRGILKIKASGTETEIIVQISNNGPMIPEDIKEKIFEKFFTTKARKNGSGLGLSIVKSVLDDHAAKMTLESTNEWTTFTFIFKRLSLNPDKKNDVQIELL